MQRMFDVADNGNIIHNTSPIIDNISLGDQQWSNASVPLLTSQYHRQYFRIAYRLLCPTLGSWLVFASSSATKTCNVRHNLHPSISCVTHPLTKETDTQSKMLNDRQGWRPSLSTNAVCGHMVHFLN